MLRGSSGCGTSHIREGFLEEAQETFGYPLGLNPHCPEILILWISWILPL